MTSTIKIGEWWYVVRAGSVMAYIPKSRRLCGRINRRHPVVWRRPQPIPPLLARHVAPIPF